MERTETADWFIYGSLFGKLIGDMIHRYAWSVSYGSHWPVGLETNVETGK